MSAISRVRGAKCEPIDGPGSRRAVAGWPLMSRAWFWVLWSFIGMVSVIDAFLVYACLDMIQYTEKNAICRFLIMLDSRHLSVFLPAKALGTLLVLSILRLIFVHRREYSLPITGGVAAYQAGLMVYLVA